MVNEIVHFELDAEDINRAVKFYSSVFDWKIERWEGPMEYWMITMGKDASGIGGAIMKREERQSHKNRTINTISVDSVDESIQKIRQNGGKVLSSKMPIPGIGFHAECLDTENNVFSILEQDKDAT